MGSIINLERFVDRPKETKGSITRKRGSGKLYVDFYYHGVRIVKTTGQDDTPENWQKARKWLDRAMERIGDGTFVFAEAFPGAPAEEKAFHARLEGWEYTPDPQDVLFGESGCGSLFAKIGINIGLLHPRISVPYRIW